MIQVENVTKKYLFKTAIQDVTLTLPTGKIIGIVGENGAGKSTLIKMIAGLVKPTKGTIFVDNEVVSRQICKQVAYMSELETYYPFYTIQEMILFHASQFKDFCQETAHRLVEIMKLDPKKKVKELSKGGRARVKILLTLSRKAPIILMDEPFSGLDPMVRRSLVQALISVVDFKQQTVIMTTHEIKEVESILDFLVAMRQGNVIKMIEVEELRASEGMEISDWMMREYL